MKSLCKLWVLAVATIFTTTACEEDEATMEPVMEEPISILGTWTFTESSVEIISLPPDSEFTIDALNVDNLTWTFDAENLIAQSPDSTWTESYRYDSISMELQFDDGTYDVLQLSKDSLRLRIYTNISLFDIEFYNFFQLVR